MLCDDLGGMRGWQGGSRVEMCIHKQMIQHVNSMKRQKDMTLKYKLPRSVSTQCATGEDWRNNSRKNEETEPK